MNTEDRRHLFMTLLVLLILTLSLVGLNNPFIFDSVGKIVTNPEIKDPSLVIERLIYPYHHSAVLNRNDPSRPVVYLTYAFNYYWGQLSPFGYHLFDILTHSLSTVLIFLITLIITKLLYSKENETLALLAALYCGIHPLLFGTATYAYGRSDTLSTALLLLSLYYYIKKETPLFNELLFSCLFYFVALYTKQSAIILPAIFLLFDFMIRSPFHISILKKHLPFYLPFAAITLFYLLHRILYFGGIGDLEAQLGGTWSFLDYITIQPIIFFYYLYLYINPTSMALDRYITAETYPASFKLLAFVGLFIFFWSLYRLYKSSYPHKRLALFGITYYLLYLLPTSSFLPTVDAMVDRRVYTGSFGLFLAIFSFLGTTSFRWPLLQKQKTLATFLSVHLVLLSGYSFYRTKLFQNPEDVWISVLKLYPDSKRAINNLGLRYFTLQKYDLAIEQYKKLMGLHPEDHFPHMNIARIYANAATPYYDAKLAEHHFQEALKRLPEFAYTHFFYASFLFDEGRYEDAKKEFDITLQQNPNMFEALEKLKLISEVSKGNTSMFKKEDEIPIDQVNPSIIINIYKDALKKDPNNKVLKQKYEEFCSKRKGLCPNS